MATGGKSASLPMCMNEIADHVELMTSVTLDCVAADEKWNENPYLDDIDAPIKLFISNFASNSFFNSKNSAR